MSLNAESLEDRCEEKFNGKRCTLRTGHLGNCLRGDDGEWTRKASGHNQQWIPYPPNLKSTLETIPLNPDVVKLLTEVLKQNEMILKQNQGIIDYLSSPPFPLLAKEFEAFKR